MLDMNGKRVNENEVKKLCIKNKLFKQMARRANKVGIDIKYAYLMDGNSCVLLDTQKACCEMWIDGVENNKFKMRVVGKGMAWNDWTFDSYENFIERQKTTYKFLKWLKELDVSDLYSVTTKNDNFIANGQIHHYDNNAIVYKIKDYLKHYYDVSHLCFEGIKTDKYILIVSPNGSHAEHHFTAYFDIHIFNVNGDYVKCITNMNNNNYSYSNFFVDDVLIPNNDKYYGHMSIRYCDVDYIGNNKVRKTYHAIWDITKEGTIITHKFQLDD